MARTSKKTVSLNPLQKSESNGAVYRVWTISKYSFVTLLFVAELIIAPFWFVINGGASQSLGSYLFWLGLWVLSLGVVVVVATAYSAYILYEWMLDSATIKKKYHGNFATIIPFSAFVFLVNLFVVVAFLVRLNTH